jgi:hypothetical protein
MKKLLSIIGTITIATSGSMAVTSCAGSSGHHGTISDGIDFNYYNIRKYKNFEKSSILEFVKDNVAGESISTDPNDVSSTFVLRDFKVDGNYIVITMQKNENNKVLVVNEHTVLISFSLDESEMQHIQDHINKLCQVPGDNFDYNYFVQELNSFIVSYLDELKNESSIPNYVLTPSISIENMLLYINGERYSGPSSQWTSYSFPQGKYIINDLKIVMRISNNENPHTFIGHSDIKPPIDSVFDLSEVDIDNFYDTLKGSITHNVDDLGRSIRISFGITDEYDGITYEVVGIINSLIVGTPPRDAKDFKLSIEYNNGENEKTGFIDWSNVNKNRTEVEKYSTQFKDDENRRKLNDNARVSLRVESNNRDTVKGTLEITFDKADYDTFMLIFPHDN